MVRELSWTPTVALLVVPVIERYWNRISPEG